MEASRLGVGADRAGILRVDIAADLADLDFLHRRFQRGGKRRHQQFALFDEMQRRAPRRARAQSRQPRQQLNQALDFGSGNGGGHYVKFNPGGSGKAAGDSLHLFLHHGFRLAPRIGVRRHHQVLENFLFRRLKQRIVDLDALEVAFGGDRYRDHAAAGRAFDLDLVEFGLHGLHLGLQLRGLLHQAQEVRHRSISFCA